MLKGIPANVLHLPQLCATIRNETTLKGMDMHLEVFIGAVDVPEFSWQDSPADTKDFAVSPRIISDAIPDSYRIFWEVTNLAKNEKFVSKAIDWGTCAVRVSKEELIEFLRSMYETDIMDDGGQYVRSRQDELRDLKTDPDNEYLIQGCEMEIQEMKDLVRLINGLDPDEQYALVAQES